MCGILAILGKKMLKERSESLLKKLAGRGPEGGRFLEGDGFQLGFTRLAINGLNSSGMQPMQGEGLAWMCNGEIYNYLDLAKSYGITQMGSDCSVLGGLFKKLGSMTDARTFFQSLDGVFAMVIIDAGAGIAYVARDPYGVRPLYVGYVVDKNTVVNIILASELKALELETCTIVEAFPPGHYAAYDLKTLQRIGFEPYHSVPWLKNPLYTVAKEAQVALNVALVASVKKRMMTERPVAALLSGGLDSSLVAALVQKQLLDAGKEPLKTFSIGFTGSEDLSHARLVADHIGSDHTEIVMTPKEFFDAVPEVIKDIESYDITTVRASVGNWLVSREIARRTDCKVVFNGDGADEVFGGYKYFYSAPSDEAFEYESTRLLQDIHNFDVLRSDRCISSHGLEPRTPFLDKQFVAVAKSISTSLRRPIKGIRPEKQVLRLAFHDGLLPDSVLFRAKEAFSDGVSGLERSWYTECQERAEGVVGLEWRGEAGKFKHLTPTTAEAYYYRSIFNKYYGMAETCVPYLWMPKWVKATDPSARTLV
jgi:asparagine synthase (glutamine-hydrolysing)